MWTGYFVSGVQRGLSIILTKLFQRVTGLMQHWIFCRLLGLFYSDSQSVRLLLRALHLPFVVLFAVIKCLLVRCDCVSPFHIAVAIIQCKYPVLLGYSWTQTTPFLLRRCKMLLQVKRLFLYETSSKTILWLSWRIDAANWSLRY